VIGVSNPRQMSLELVTPMADFEICIESYVRDNE
jgi:hypothetical protein